MCRSPGDAPGGNPAANAGSPPPNATPAPAPSPTNFFPTRRRSRPQLPLAQDGKPYTTLGYANGPGAVTVLPRPDPAAGDTTALDFRQQSLVPLGSETHGGEDVVVRASGPMAHLFGGTIEQHTIFHVVNEALGGSAK